MAHVSTGECVRQAPPARRAAGRLATALRGWRNRRAAVQLARLDDRMLADIGLRRSDVERALALPLWQDPTRELYRIAAERRSAWRRRW